MGKFVIGILVGVALAAGYVHLNWQLPEVLQLPRRLQGNLISTTTESALYDLGGDADTRRRALEVYFANRSTDAARIDAEAGHPLLKALVAERARREARQLLAIGGSVDRIVETPALRDALVRKHGTDDREALKQAVLAEALDERPFLKGWLEANIGPVTRERLAETLAKAARDP